MEHRKGIEHFDYDDVLEQEETTTISTSSVTE